MTVAWPEREEKGWGRRERFTAWHLLRSRWLQVRLHRILEPDEPAFLHGHPRPFLSLMLWGKYFEERLGRPPAWRRIGGLAWRPGDAPHAAWHPHGKASWSLVFFFGPKRPWAKVYRCERCGLIASSVTRAARRTAYVYPNSQSAPGAAEGDAQDPNYANLCAPCWVEDNAYWEERWAEYYGGLL